MSFAFVLFMQYDILVFWVFFFLFLCEGSNTNESLTECSESFCQVSQAFKIEQTKSLV